MSLSSPTYLAFLGIVLVMLVAVRAPRGRLVVIVAASYVFYSWLDWRLGLLLAGITLLNHMGAGWIGTAREGGGRTRLAIVVAGDLLVLAAFKYAGFFADSANAALGRLGIRLPVPDILLPLGISFITFQVISYVVDVYRGDIERAPLLEVAALVAFFPHLAAGPILKPARFLPQLRDGISVSSADLDAGLQLFVFGLAKKVLIADRLATFVDPVMRDPGFFSSATLRLAVIAYAIQLYADFSGYSDMAIGAARSMGLDIPPNFNAPYAARSITDFWRRWHISLSTWLREYLYIPLGGNRRGRTRQTLNLVVVMLLAGLWHGAGWNFIVWGGLHGVALAMHKVWTDRVVAGRAGTGGLPARIAGWIVTFAFVTLAWVFFRIENVSTAWSVVVRVCGFGASDGLVWHSTWALLLVPLVLALDVALRSKRGRVPRVRIATFKGAFIATSFAIAFALFWPTAPTPFIYIGF